MINTSSLKRRIGALAPPESKQYIFLKSRDFKDAAERHAAGVEQGKNPSNIIIMQNIVDSSGCVLWKGSKVNEPPRTDADQGKNKQISKPHSPIIFEKTGATYG